MLSEDMLDSVADAPSSAVPEQPATKPRETSSKSRNLPLNLAREEIPQMRDQHAEQVKEMFVSFLTHFNIDVVRV